MAPTDSAQALRPTPTPIETTFSPAVASALRTIETERDGLACLMEAIGNGLGVAFTEAVSRIAPRQGPRHPHRHGKVRPCRAQDRSDARLDGNAGALLSTPPKRAMATSA